MVSQLSAEPDPDPWLEPEPEPEPEPSSPPTGVTTLLHAGTAKDVAAKSRIEILFMGLL
jgi:hypothetical protein